MSEGLRAFVRESNRIEGIRKVRPCEVAATCDVLYSNRVTVESLQAFVSVCQPGAVLRDREGLNVRVGTHLPPFGGPLVVERLREILSWAPACMSPYSQHRAYETLHPFTDGNGRSGRVFWLWCMRQRGDLDWALKLGFLHSWYYQSLEAK